MIIPLSFILIYALGLILRVPYLFGKPFWFDEAITYHFAVLNVKDLIQAVATDSNPPFFYLLIHFVTRFSSDALILRLPSLVFGILATIFVYILTKKILDSKIALVSSALFWLSPLSIYTSTETRLHSMATFLAIVLALTFFNYLKKPNFKNRLIFLFVSVASLYTHYYLALLIVAIIILSLFKTKKSIWVQNFLVIFLAFLPWMIVYLKTAHNGCWCPNSVLSLPATLVSPVINGLGYITIRDFKELPPFVLLLFSSCVILCLYLFIKGLLKKWSLTLIYSFPLLLLSFFGLFFPIFSPKGFSIFSPFYFMIVSLSLGTKSRLKWLPVLLLLLISTIQVTDRKFYSPDLKKAFQITQGFPSLHSSIITFYPFVYYSQNPKGNRLISPNPLNENTVSFIGGKEEPVKILPQSFWLINDEKFTDMQKFLTLEETIQNEGYTFSQTIKIDKMSLFRTEKP